MGLLATQFSTDRKITKSLFYSVTCKDRHLFSCRNQTLSIKYRECHQHKILSSLELTTAVNKLQIFKFETHWKNQYKIWTCSLKRLLLSEHVKKNSWMMLLKMFIAFLLICSMGANHFIVESEGKIDYNFDWRLLHQR